MNYLSLVPTRNAARLNFIPKTSYTENPCDFPTSLQSNAGKIPSNVSRPVVTILSQSIIHYLPAIWHCTDCSIYKGSLNKSQYVDSYINSNISLAFQFSLNEDPTTEHDRFYSNSIVIVFDFRLAKFPGLALCFRGFTYHYQLKTYYSELGNDSFISH